MKPVDNYLRRIAFWLPLRGRHRLLGDIREAVEAHLDDCHARQGATLSEEQVAATLARFGHPALVAARFTSQHPLVAVGLMLAYKRVLMLAAAGILLVRLASQVLFPAPLGWEFAEELADAVLLAFVVVTLAFAILTRRYTQPSALDGP